MEEWKEYRIKDLGEVVTGNTPPTSNREYYGTEYKFIKPTDMVEGQRFVPTTEEYYSELAYQKYKKCLLPPKTPCVVTIGSLGKKMCLTDTECFTNQAVNAVIPNKENDGEFLYYAFKASVLAYVKQLDSGTTSGRENVSKSSFSKIKVRVPSLPTQQKIASILSAYDKLIQNYKKQIEALQTAASELYKEWFVRFRFPGYQIAKFENGIPKGWKVEKIGEYCNIRIGGDVPEENFEIKDEKHKYPIFSNGINEDGLYGFTDTFKISEPSVTISARGTVGFVCLRREPYYPIVRLICLIPRKELGVFYLYHSLKYADLDGNGTSQQQLTAPMVSKRKIMIAEEKLIEKFNLNAKIIYDKIDLLKIQITNLTQQRDLLLPRLMSGKLEVE